MGSIALVSLNQVWEDKATNLAECEALAKKAVGQGAELLIFPEMTLTGFSMNSRKIAEEIDGSQTIKKFVALCQKLQVKIVFGAALKYTDGVKNCLVYIDESGVVQTVYEKINLFFYADEHLHYAAGSKTTTAQINEFTAGFSICFDLRFPVMMHELGRGSDLLINIANWPKKRVGHWSALLKARAIENQCFMIGVNRIGVDGNGLLYAKSSAIFDANGKKLRPYYSAEQLDIYNVEKSKLQEFIKKFPIQKSVL